jgi:HD-like signal output (HDOD) protein
MNKRQNVSPGCDDIRRVIADKADLLALPDAVIRVLELTSKDEIGIDQLSAVLGSDPALTGRLFKIANSPLYHLSQHVASIQQAVMVLGITTVKCLVLSAALFDPKKIQENIGFDVKALYGNIVSVASTCRKLAYACSYKSPDDAFTCGLLHEIGLLFFLQYCPELYQKVITRAADSGSLIGEEKITFGISHPEVGQLIAEKWRLPEEIPAAIGNHHSFGISGSKKLDDILRLSVALNQDYFVQANEDLEEKVTRITTVANRLGVRPEQLDDITASMVKDTIAFAKAIDIEIYDIETILSCANHEIFRTYMSIQRLFKERQELTKSILDEERAKGIQEAKNIAISTLSHYINNAAMIISGQSQVARLLTRKEDAKRLFGSLPKSLDIIDESIYKITAVLEEISEMSLVSDVEYFDKSKVMNMDERINERILQIRERLSSDKPVAT